MTLWSTRRKGNDRAL